MDNLTCQEQSQITKKMFRLFPHSKQEWLRAFLFAFQAYVVIAFILISYMSVNWPRHYSLSYCFVWMEQFYGLSCVALFIAGNVQFFRGNRNSGIGNIILAMLAILGSLTFRSFITA
jgi:hypothetical protein